jgi:Flp pilus assembly protein TadG
MGILNWLTHARRKQRALRHAIPGMVAYYWDGGAPKEHAVKNISLTGAYLYATERWYDGTIMALSFRQGASTPEAACLSVRGKIIRHGADGIGIKFMMRTKDQETALKRFIGNAASHLTERGQALIEYLLMVPLMFLLVINCVNFGVFLYEWIEVANAARAGAQYAILSGASAGGMTAATGAQIKSIITTDMSSLPGTPTVNICKNNNGTLTTLSGTCSTTTTPADPEAPLYVLATVDVNYTYTPMTGALSFPRLGIYLTIPPTSIHRQAVMRMIQ